MKDKKDTIPDHELRVLVHGTGFAGQGHTDAVSYTHLTLPTKA